MEIGFKELVKMIHPDTNPDIQDASGKMTAVLRNRRDKKALWNLAVRWGLVQGTGNPDVTVFDGDATVQVTTQPQTNPWDTGIRPTQEDILREQYNEYIRVQEFFPSSSLL